MSYGSLKYEVSEHIATVTFDRPEKLNAINGELRDELAQVCDRIYNDDDVRAAIFTGAGRGFCSGADVTGPRPQGEPEVAPQNERLDDLGWVGRLAIGIYEIGVPTIAVMNGVAAGAGMSIALACDMRVGSSVSRFKTVFAERGLSPDSGMSYFLPRLIGYGRAADLIFTSRNVGGEEAWRLGLLDRFVEESEMMSAAREIASQAASLPPMAIRSGKRVLQSNMDLDFHRALKNEYFGLSFARKSPNDQKEQRAAFVEKRKPDFTGT
ncbi:MAG: enoyl-CoA hydratase/isomerase family protein [Pseudomonadales bacterium]|nr:enoyl-CoA hydratase/isomerase family protein [Pseudomonadales bacterium]